MTEQTHTPPTPAPTSALAAIFHGPHQTLQLVRALVPTPAHAEVLVRVTHAALCSSDLHTHSGRRTEPTPTVLGHEIVGEILAFGPDAPHTDLRGDPLSPGDLVTWSIAASCGTCENCRDGLSQKCASLIKYGHERVTPEMPFRGGFAQVILLSPGTALLRIPPGLPPDRAALANCSTATVACILRTGFDRRNRPGMSVAVIGAGVLGATACAFARSVYGATTVLACDQSPERLEVARAFGATHTCLGLDALREHEGKFDVAIELAGTLETTQAALSLLKTGGTLVLAGTTRPTPPFTCEPQWLVRKLARIEGVHNYIPIDLLAAVDFLAGPGRDYPFDRLLGPAYPLTDIDQALEHGHQLPGRRVLLRPWNDA